MRSLGLRKILAGAGIFFLAFLCASCQEPPAKSALRLVKFSDLGADGVRIGIVDPDLGPAGLYALDVIEKLETSNRNLASSINSNIVTYEAQVRSLLNKLLQHEIDAGFIYRSDALVAADKLIVLEIPEAIAVAPEYSLARIKDSSCPVKTLAFIKWLRASEQEPVWLKYGFKPQLPAETAIDALSVSSGKSEKESGGRAKLTVFAAAVFYDVLQDLAQLYETLNRVEIVCEFAGSGKLYQKIEQGAQGEYGADLFLSASPVYIEKLADSGLVDNPQRFMRNDLVIGVAK